MKNCIHLYKSFCNMDYLFFVAERPRTVSRWIYTCVIVEYKSKYSLAITNHNDIPIVLLHNTMLLKKKVFYNVQLPLLLDTIITLAVLTGYRATMWNTEVYLWHVWRIQSTCTLQPKIPRQTCIKWYSVDGKNNIHLMPWSHLCVKPPRMSNVRQI